MSESGSKGEIKEGNIAQFMRKRTQLVGFSIERHKHTQYAAEFLDNSLDAIEAAHWKHKLFKDLSSESPIIEYPSFPWEGNGGKLKAATISARLKEILEPLKDIINDEPIALIMIHKVEKPEILPDDIQGSDIEMYSFEAFDNGSGIRPVDLEKYGIYLASSKAEKLRQTRGSQGFGAPSAFSDAQNTTGRPITVISKHIKEKKGELSVFYTTGENKKKYTIEPTGVVVPFKHGTYVQLWYLNVKYVRGYADEYIRQTSLLNSHITLIFVDPIGEVAIYPRRVSMFPVEPVYTEPHPESTSIGDFQELIRNTKTSRVVDYLTTSFCRIGSKRAKDIIENANVGLRSKLTPNSQVKKLSDDQINALYRSFISMKYPSPPVDTVVPVGKEVLQEVIKKNINAEFVEAVTRPPTSSKGLAFVVEAAIAYDTNNNSNDFGNMVLNRFTNRTPKLRDNSDCAIWKAAASVNWKNYKIDRGENGLPRGPVKLFVNVSGPFVHVMFKAQSKQALAADDILVREVKLALEELGRKLKSHITKGEVESRKMERAKMLLEHAAVFARSLVAVEQSDPELEVKPTYEEVYKNIEAMVNSTERKISRQEKRESQQTLTTQTKAKTKTRTTPKPETESAPSPTTSTAPKNIHVHQKVRTEGLTEAAKMSQ
ncbi:MAG: DNA topoisomerase VI subunit B [Candidatus Freyarchaeum deiterrae]